MNGGSTVNKPIIPLILLIALIVGLILFDDFKQNRVPWAFMIFLCLLGIKEIWQYAKVKH